MIRANDTLFVGGMANQVDPKRGAPPAGAALERNGRGLLRVVSGRTGRTLGEVRLDSPPVWDGISAAAGRLYVSLEDGTVVCLGGRPPVRQGP